MKLSKLLKKGAVLLGTTALSLIGLSGVVMADYTSAGDYIEGWSIQFVAQNGETGIPEQSNIMMLGSNGKQLKYQMKEHMTISVRSSAFELASDNLLLEGLYFGYEGSYTGDAVFDVTLTNITINSKGFDPITVADFSSKEAGLDKPVSGGDYHVVYDFKDQIDLAIRTASLQSIDSIEFDIKVDYATFTDAPDVNVVPTDENGNALVVQEQTVKGGPSGFVLQVYGMDSEKWKWKDVTPEATYPYQVKKHFDLDIDPSVFDFGSGIPMSRLGFQLLFNTMGEDQAFYAMNYTLSNIVLSFDGYDPVAVPDFDSMASGVYNKAIFQYEILEYFPEGADISAMMGALKKVSFDIEIKEEGKYVAEAVWTEPTLAEDETTISAEGDEPGDAETEEVTEAPTEEVTEAATEKETEKATKEDKEDTTEAEAEETEKTTVSETEAESQAEKTTAAESEKKGNSITKIIVTVAAVLLLIGALAFVGLSYVKKSKM